MRRTATGLGISALAASLAMTYVASAEPVEAAASDDGTALQEVVVTGSHIRGVDLAPVVNVQVIDAEQLQKSGATQVADLIKEIPSNSGTALYNESGLLSGTAQFELRGLGFSSTLVLLNGRRAGVSPLSDKSGADFVDINQFPLAMVGRIDVLKDGSSGIYGSEAVAGVVNIVSRKGFQGFEASADFADSTNQAYSVNLASGHRFDGGSVNLYATYYHQTGNLRSDFPWLLERVGGNGTPGLSQLINNNGFPGTYQLATTNAAGRPVAVSSAKSVADPNCQAAGGVFQVSATTGAVNRATCFIDFANQIGVIPAENRIQAFVEASYTFNDRLSYFNETSGSHNANNIHQTAASYANGAAVGGLIYVPASSPFNFFVADPADPKNVVAIDPAQWNPAVNQAVAVVGNLRPQGSYVSGDKRQTNTYFRTVNGLDLLLAHDWRATASHSFAHAEFQELNPLGVNATLFNNLIATGLYNPFGTSITNPTLVSPKDGKSVAGNSQAVLNQIFYTSNLTRKTEQNVVDASASGPVVELPTGKVSAAAGVQYRRQNLQYNPDTLVAAGLGTTSVLDAPFSRSQNILSQYVEAIIPIYTLVEIQVALRHEDYGSDIGATTDPKITGRLNLFSGLLTLRGSWGTSFQAPTLTQEGNSQLLSVINDPVIPTANGFGCSSTSTGSGTTVITAGGNLEPQKSRNFNFGFDLKPTPSVLFTTDFWRYDYRNLIAAGQNAQSIVSGECVNGVYVDDPRTERLPGGLVRSVTTSYVNVGKVVTDGIDVSGSWSTPLASLGNLAFRADATYVRKFDAHGANGLVSHNVASRNFNNNFAPMPHWRGNTRLVWSMGMNEVALGANYAGSYRNDQDFNAPIDAFTTVDWQYALNLKSTTIAVGMNNALDRDPPALTRYTSAGVPVTGPTAFGRPGYDPLGGANIQGRVVYARIKQAF